MAEDQGKEEEKLDFTREGEAVGYISLAKARLLAMQTARDTPGEYGGRRYRNVAMVFETMEAIEAEDFYTITLSFRPQGQFSGTPGQEQFFIEKEGTVAVRQVLSVPLRRGGFPLLPVAIGLVVVGVIAAVGAVFALSGSGDDRQLVAVAPPPETQERVVAPTPLTDTPIPLPTYTPIPKAAPTATPRIVRVTATPVPRPTTPTPDACSYYNKAEDCYYKKGDDYFSDEKYALAVDEFTTAIRLDPSYTNAYWMRGLAYERLGQYQQATEDYDKAIPLDPNQAQLYFNRGWAYGNLRQYQLAIRDFDKAIRLDVDFADAYWGRGFAYQQLRQYEKADADKAKACSLDSEHC